VSFYFSKEERKEKKNGETVLPVAALFSLSGTLTLCLDAIRVCMVGNNRGV